MLTKCRECKKEISSKTESCPHCGHRALAPQIIRGILFAVIVLVLLRLLA